jgi:hypothetical protein
MNQPSTNTTTIQPQAAPIRCFFDDIPNIIAMHHQQQHQQTQISVVSTEPMEISGTTTSCMDTMMTLHDNNTNNKKRRKITLEKYIPSTLWLRLLGTVVNVSSSSSATTTTAATIDDRNYRNYITKENIDTNQQQDSNPYMYNYCITLDDGTGMVMIDVTFAMMQQITIQNGIILDCIVRVEQHKQPHTKCNRWTVYGSLPIKLQYKMR